MIILWDIINEESFERKKKFMFEIINSYISFMKNAGAMISEEVAFFYEDHSSVSWIDLPENLNLKDGVWFGVGIDDDGKDFTVEQRECFNLLLKQKPLNTQHIAKLYNERK